MRRIAVWLLLVGAAVVVGLGLSFAVMFVLAAILPPFRPEDDDTMRDYGPVLIAYAVWGITSISGAVLAWRWLDRRPRSGRHVTLPGAD